MTLISLISLGSTDTNDFKTDILFPDTILPHREGGGSNWPREMGRGSGGNYDILNTLDILN